MNGTSLLAVLKDWKTIATLVGGMLYGLWHGIVWADNAIEAIQKVDTLEELSRTQGELLRSHATEIRELREEQAVLIQQNTESDTKILNKLDQLLGQQR